MRQWHQPRWRTNDGTDPDGRLVTRPIDNDEFLVRDWREKQLRRLGSPTHQTECATASEVDWPKIARWFSAAAVSLLVLNIAR